MLSLASKWLVLSKSNPRRKKNIFTVKKVISFLFSKPVLFVPTKLYLLLFFTGGVFSIQNFEQWKTVYKDPNIDFIGKNLEQHNLHEEYFSEKANLNSEVFASKQFHRWIILVRWFSVWVLIQIRVKSIVKIPRVSMKWSSVLTKKKLELFLKISFDNTIVIFAYPLQTQLLSVSFLLVIHLILLQLKSL